MAEYAREQVFIDEDLTGSGQNTSEMVTGQQEEVAVSIGGTFSATVQLQRSLDGGTTWHPVTAAENTSQDQSAAIELDYKAPAGMRLRVRCTSYTSGTVNVQMKKG